MGMKPFIEIGFMPSALAKKKKKVFYYKASVSTPKVNQEWIDLIESFIYFLIERYGKEEVESWFFEVWNEPDLRGFFFTGTRKEYFHLYQITAKTIKAILPNVQIGGPATSQNRWLKEFQEFCIQTQTPLDYLSTHHYPGDDIGLPIFTIENLKRLLFTAKNNQDKSVHDVFHKMMYSPKKLPLIQKDSMYKQVLQARQESGNLPLYYTEWNVNPTSTALSHDDCSSAAFIIKHVLDNQYLMEGCSFWTFSDIFEENTFFPEPFSGSYGLMNIYGIPKPSYWAFYILNQLGKERLILPITHDKVEIAGFKDQHKLQLLIYRQDYVFDEIIENIHVDIPTQNHLKQSSITRINEDCVNPKQYWKDIGSPNYLSTQEVNKICEETKPQTIDICFNYEDGHYYQDLNIQSNEIILIEMIFEEEEI